MTIPRDMAAAIERGRVAYLRACELDVMVRKPGNVSIASAGHGMQAAQFLASAKASAQALFAAGASVGERIEGAVEASWAVAGCNTNLGIVLLCAPVAAALELRPDARSAFDLQVAIESVLQALDLGDANAAFRAIARAHPAGLGQVSEQDVHAEADVDFRAAMVLAAPRDRIARQYAEGYREVFSIGWTTGLDQGASHESDRIDPALALAVQQCFLRWLSSGLDTHIERKHGPQVATQVLHEAQQWQRAALAGIRLDDDEAWRQWDLDLKARAVNPGTSADLTVVSLMLSMLGGVI